MNKSRIRYECSSCGANYPKWVGRCAVCGEWDSVVEQAVPSAAAAGAMPHRIASSPGAGPQTLSEVSRDPADVRRLRTGIGELDNILGGGLVPGSLLLLGGDPGIGKSALMLQLAGSLAAGGVSVLYLSGEESPAQIGMRAGRLAVDGGEK